MTTKILAALLLCAALGKNAYAQSTHFTRSPADSALPPAGWKLGAWIAGGWNEPLKTRYGHVHDRTMFMSGIDFSRVIARSEIVDIRYTPTLLPLIIGTANREYNSFATCSGVSFCLLSDDGKSFLVPYTKTAYAAGILPIDFDTDFAPNAPVGLFIGIGGGASIWDRRIPDPRETRFNFLADVHVGLHARSAFGNFGAGLRLQHLSNGNLGPVNPGMDSHIYFLSWQR